MLTGSYKNKFGMLKFARIVFSLGAIVLAGCSSQEIYVYENFRRQANVAVTQITGQLAPATANIRSR